ncbi:MAG TPA: FAD-dependent oxidoreductase, partial [Gammaproteobacteria bacterium]|nr:FAD-dependent oxidoreductase [Gammaproteobacteria bacterium]
HELGILQELLQRPHQIAAQLRGYIEDQKITVADFSKLSVKCPYIVFMPQWDFLDFLAIEARKYPTFTLHMQYDVTDLIKHEGKIVGVRASTPQGIVEINSHLVIGADGRHSTVRRCAGLESTDIGAPIDVFWFRLSRKPSDPDETYGKFSAGRIMVMINRRDYWQCGYVIAKGNAEQHQKQDIAIFRAMIVKSADFLADRVDELKSWDDVKLLSITIDRLQRWHIPGLLCIGDSAHAMSPVGGVGINLAIQDAVATANILAPHLKENNVTSAELQAVQARREFPVKVIQFLQVIVQNRVISNVLHKTQKLQMPTFVRHIQRLSFVQRCVGYIIGIGVRPEHIEATD